MMKELKNSIHMQHRTFGLSNETATISPLNFLKKDEGIQRHYERPKTSHHTKCTLRRPPVPKHNELNMLPNNEMKNFKMINKVRAKTALTRTFPTPQRFEQKPPIYIHKPKYGKCPKYLKDLREAKRELNELKIKEEEEIKEKNKIRIIEEEEKKKLLDGLKHNWQKLQEEYQKMPLLIDSVPKMIRKTKLENNLKSLERDICLLNTNSNRIFILPDK